MNQECYNLRTDLRVITKLSPSYGGSISSNYISVRMIEIAYPSMIFVIVSVHCYTSIRCFSSYYYLTSVHNHNSVHSFISVNCSSVYYFTSIHCTTLYCSNLVHFYLFLLL